MAPFRTVLRAGWLLTIACSLCGCESLTLGMSPWEKSAATTADKSATSTIETQRERYRADRSPKAQRWLLAHGVKPQMTVAEINTVFGEDGERVYDDAWLKKGNGYRGDDMVYRWGPDRQGRNIYLVFRNGNLVNFDPKEFE